MNNKISRSGYVIGGGILGVIVIGQIVSAVLALNSWKIFVQRLPVILSMVAFWGPIVAAIAAGCVYGILWLLGFRSLAEIRAESVEQNNPTPAIIFVGTLIASILFLTLVIRP